MLAVLVDALIVAIPYIVAARNSLPMAVRLVGLAATVVLLAIQIVWLTQRGQTIGKRVVGIRIVLIGKDSETQKEPLQNGGFVVNVLKRGLITGLLNLVPFFFLVDSLFIYREDRRCIHDFIAGTCVIKQ